MLRASIRRVIEVFKLVLDKRLREQVVKKQAATAKSTSVKGIVLLDGTELAERAAFSLKLSQWAREAF